MNEYIMVNDIHLSDRAPSSCTETYLDDLFALLDEVSTLARERRAKAVILAGDVFHHKTPGRTTHATVMRLINWARSNPCPVYTVLGNHDLQFDRVSSIDETQPLGVVIKSGAVMLLDGWIKDGSAPVFGMPWQMTYDDPTVEAALLDFTAWHLDRPALVVTHAPLYPPGNELPYEFYPATKWACAMGNRGTVHYGHVHHPHGVYEVDGVMFSNCGALSRGSLHEHNLTRPIQVAVWNCDTGLTEHVTLPHKPAADVFRLAEAKADKSAALDLNDFLAKIDQTTLNITTTESVVAHVKDMGLSEDLVKVVTKLLDEVSG